MGWRWFKLRSQLRQNSKMQGIITKMDETFIWQEFQRLCEHWETTRKRNIGVQEDSKEEKYWSTGDSKEEKYWSTGRQQGREILEHRRQQGREILEHRRQQGREVLEHRETARKGNIGANKIEILFLTPY